MPLLSVDAVSMAKYAEASIVDPLFDGISRWYNRHRVFGNYERRVTDTQCAIFSGTGLALALALRTTSVLGISFAI